MYTIKLTTVAFFGAALTASAALAQDYPDPQDPIEPAEPVPGPVPTEPDDDEIGDADARAMEEARTEDDDEDLLTRYGLSLTVGGGVSGFTDETMRDTADPGGIWDVRAAFGTHYPIAIEAAYIGSAQAIDAVGLDDSAVLIGTAVEGIARVNLMSDSAINPYFFGGAAWRRYDLTNADTNTSDVSDTDNLLEIPVGLGAGYRARGFVADLRGELRIASEEDLVRRDIGADRPRMHTWSASAKLGYEF